MSLKSIKDTNVVVKKKFVEIDLFAHYPKCKHINLP